MSNLKDTDIDDLFRRASDKYPLRTDSADWDRMAAALENKGPMPPDGPVAPEEERKKRRFFWLFFLLLPLAGAGYFAWHHAVNTVGKGVASGTHISAGTSTSTGTSTNTSTSTNTGTSTSTSTNTGTSTDVVSSDPDASHNATGIAAPTPAAAQTATSRFAATRGRRHPGRTTSSQNANENSTGENSTTENRTTGKGTTKTTTTGDVFIANGPAVRSKSLANDPTTGDRLFYDLRRAPIPHDYRLAVNVTAPPAKKDSAAKPKDKTKHFYAGIFGSPDLSTVKMQSVKGVGTTFGVILGYTFNGGRWAIETGAYLDRKKYYTEGEYFNTKEINLPPSTWLTNVDGTCYMWEIPLNARYNFNPGAKTSWFATAGLSTYLMTRENYNYGLEWPGSTRPYNSDKNIPKSSQYPFSIINLSAGFEQRLGKIGNLRVEPYVRVPLTGLGTGKLPIMSAGVNIGITRQLW